jgi:hypothetical protein
MPILGYQVGAKLVFGRPKSVLLEHGGTASLFAGFPRCISVYFRAYWILKVTPEISGFAWILEMFQSNSTIELPLPKPSWLYLMVH